MEVWHSRNNQDQATDSEGLMEYEKRKENLWLCGKQFAQFLWSKAVELYK